jgi:hypothetical protein
MNFIPIKKKMVLSKGVSLIHARFDSRNAK